MMTFLFIEKEPNTGLIRHTTEVMINMITLLNLIFLTLFRYCVKSIKNNADKELFALGILSAKNSPNTHPITINKKHTTNLTSLAWGIFSFLMTAQRITSIINAINSTLPNHNGPIITSRFAISKDNPHSLQVSKRE